MAFLKVILLNLSESTRLQLELMPAIGILITMGVSSPAKDRTRRIMLLHWLGMGMMGKEIKDGLSR